jgi:hypothetical protein
MIDKANPKEWVLLKNKLGIDKPDVKDKEKKSPSPA